MDPIRFIWILVFLNFTGLTFSQNVGTISGYISNKKTEELIVGAAIVDYNNKSIGTVSNINGYYKLALSKGKHQLSISYTGMKADTFSIFIDSSSNITKNSALSSIDYMMNVVVVSASKYEQNIEEITVSMEVLKPKLIENRNTSTIDKALEQVPGLNILDNEPQIRGGSGFSFGVGSRVATLIDGIPVLQGDVGRTEWAFIPVENTEQVEVIKGAASVLYGSSALSGVINVRTSYPKGKPITKARMYSGIYSSPDVAGTKWWDGNAFFSGASAYHSQQIGKCDLVLSIFGTNDHNFIGPPVKIPWIHNADTAITEKDVANRTGRFSFNFRYRPTKIPGLNMGINGNFMQAHNNFTLVWGNDSTGLYRAYPATMTIQDQTLFYLDPFINYISKNGIKHSLRGRYFYTNNLNGNKQSNKSNVYYAEYQFAKTLSLVEDLNLTGGIVANQTYSNAPLFSFSGSPDNHLENFAGYTQLDKKFWKVVNFSMGFRGEFFRINGTENVLKPIFRTGINIKMAQATFLRYSYGQGYRYPTIAEKYIFTNAGGITIYPNPEVKPETSWNTEVGLKQGFKIGMFQGFADIAVFWQEYQNTIEYIYAVWRPDSVGFKFINTGDTRVRGVDISIMGEGKIGNNWTISILAGYTYTLPQSIHPGNVFAQDNPAIGIPPNQLSFVSTSTDTSNYILKYRFQHLAKADVEATWKNLSFGGSWRFYSYIKNIDNTFYLLDNPNQPGSGITKYRETHRKPIQLLDARISYMIKKQYKAAIVVNNIFNKSYSLRPLKIESPRTICLQLSLSL